MAKLMYKYNKEKATAEDCLIRMLEWVGGWNNQFMVADLSQEEFKEAIEKIKKSA